MDIIETLIIIGIVSLIGFVSDRIGPQEYYYENRIVTVYKKYQCPKYCEAYHNHYVYYVSDTNGMTIDKNKLGKRYKYDRMEKAQWR